MPKKPRRKQSRKRKRRSQDRSNKEIRHSSFNITNNLDPRTIFWWIQTLSTFRSGGFSERVLFLDNGGARLPCHASYKSVIVSIHFRKKLDIVRSMMDCLLAKCIPWYVRICLLNLLRFEFCVRYCKSLLTLSGLFSSMICDSICNPPFDVVKSVTDCVMAELEKLGGKYKIALRLAKDPRFERIPCNCGKNYADDCLTNMVTQWRCFIVATCDKELRARIRKIPGVPCMYISGYKFTVERMPNM